MNDTLEENLQKFKIELVRLKTGESCIEQAGEKCIDLAAGIIPEMESMLIDMQDALKGLTIAMGSETDKHSLQVKIAQVKARTILNIYAQNHG